MAQNTPEGLDEFLTDMDPQSAVASKGMGQIATAVGEVPAVQKALDVDNNLKEYNDMVMSAIEGDEASKAALAEHNMGMVTGSMKAPTSGGAIQRIQNTLGLSTKSPGFNDRVKAAEELYAKASEAIKSGKLDPSDLKYVQQHAVTARSLAGRKNFAKGGEVGSLYPSVPKVPVAGFAVAAPEGLDEFLEAPSPSVAMATSSSTPGEPEGLNDFIGEELQQEKYGSLGQQAKAGLEGAAQGLVGPLAPLAETKLLGVKEEDILGRAEANPVTHYGSEIVGLAGPALLTGGSSLAGKGALAGLAKFTQAGALEAVAKKVLPEAASQTLAAQIGTTAAKAAIDNMLIAGSDETSKMILNDPKQSAQTAISNIGLAAALGGGLGGALGAASPIWKATVGDKVSKLAHDFKARINEHMTEPNPVEALRSELSDYHGKIKALGDDVYGPAGLKAKDISKAMPEMNEKISLQAQSIYDDVGKSVKKMTDKQNSYPPRLTAKLQGDMEAFSSALSKEDLTAADVFNATQDLKQSLQGYSKFDKFVKPVDEAYEFVRDAKQLAHKLRASLEDTGVWGKAAERQLKINDAFKEYLPALKDFEKKFTSKVGDEVTIDPGKINTYINQLGKPNAELKQSMLKNFLDASEKYKKVIGETHANLGIESPVEDAAMNATISTLGEKTAGAKLADAFIKKGLTDAGGKGLGAAVGGGLGELLGGHGGGALGAIIGTHALGPFFSSVLPGIAKVLVHGEPNAAGLKASIDYGMAVAKGESALSKATKNVFKAGSTAVSEAMPSERDTAKLDKMLRQIQTNPEVLMNKATDNHYLPDHGMAVDETSANAVNYLNSLRPDLDRKAPLDAKPVASSTQKAAYQNALHIAQDPLIVLDKVKKGNVTLQDVVTLKNVYPDLYNRMKTKVTDDMVTSINKGELVPYKTRIGVSVLLGQPLDSTMTPMAIQAAQLSNGNKNPESQERAPGSETKSKGVKSSPALQKMPGMYQTPGQARQQRQNKD